MGKHKNDKLRILTMTAMLAALTTVATLVIRIPTVTKGYINLGDTIVSLSAWLLGPAYGAAAAGFGSALADMIAGYTVYAPATLVIKALMAVAAWYGYAAASKRLPGIPARIAAAVVAELVMVVGYAAFEGVLYGSVEAAWLSVTGNVVQGVFGAGASVALYETVLRRLPRISK